MGRTNNEISIHKAYFENQAASVQEVIARITKENRLTKEDSQTVRTLLDLYDRLIDPKVGVTL